MEEREARYKKAPGGGRVRVPWDFGEPVRAEVVVPSPVGQGVELMFVQRSLDPESELDGATHEVVANILLPRDNFERLVGMLQETLD